MLASVTHILPLTTVRKERMLPVGGKVVVRKGQKVNATDTIAEANLSPAHILIDVARGLGLTAERAENYIQVEPGNRVSEGDIIAGPVGFTRRVVRSTKDGTVLLVGDGQVLLELKNQPYELKAGIPGTVLELIPERGAVIQTTGALIQGVWGNGGVDFGLMYVKAGEPGEVLTSDQLDVSLRGAVILAGHVENVEVLKTAAELQLRGLILSSMDPALATVARKLQMPVLVLAGFGSRPMDEDTFKLLTTNERREVALIAERWDRHAGTRPELVIPLPAPGEPSLAPDVAEFTSGKKVRVLRAPYAGKVGTLEEVVGLVQLPNGIKAQSAEIHFGNGNSAVLPLANLEVLE